MDFMVVFVRDDDFHIMIGIIIININSDIQFKDWLLDDAGSKLMNRFIIMFFLFV